MESEVDSFTVELVSRGCVPHLQGGVVKCSRRSAGLSPRHELNRHEPFVVATYKGTTVVGHVPSLLLSWESLGLV